MLSAERSCLRQGIEFNLTAPTADQPTIRPSVGVGIWIDSGR